MKLPKVSIIINLASSTEKFSILNVYPNLFVCNCLLQFLTSLVQVLPTRRHTYKNSIIFHYVRQLVCLISETH